jgi:hypothetical protein
MSFTGNAPLYPQLTAVFGGRNPQAAHSQTTTYAPISPQPIVFMITESHYIARFERLATVILFI